MTQEKNLLYLTYVILFYFTHQDIAQNCYLIKSVQLIFQKLHILYEHKFVTRNTIAVLNAYRVLC